MLSGTAVVGSSVLTLYTAGLGGDLTAAARTWLEAQKANFSTDLTFTYPQDGDMIDDATGDIVGSWTGSAIAATTGTSSGAYARGVGYSVRWNTAGVVNSHHVRGRTFLVPCAGSMFNSDGTVDFTLAAAVNTASAAMISTLAGNLRIWSRPKPGVPGSSFAVTSASCNTVTSWLRTRKM